MTLRVGFVGVGGIAQTHLENVSKSDIAHVAAVCDVVEDVAKRVGERYAAPAYTDYRALLEKEPLDVLFVCVPPFAHGDIEEEAAARGIHLFVEKPLGLSREVVEEKAKKIREAGIITATGYCLRYLDTVQYARNYLASREVAIVNGFYTTSFVRTPWWRKMERSGGQLVEQTTHTVDMMRYLGGEVAAVQAWMSLVSSRDIEGLDIYDVGSVNLSFQSGAVGHVVTTFLQSDHRSGVEIMGRDFRVHIDGSTLTIVEPEQTIIRKSKVDPYGEQDRAFLRAVKEDDRSLIYAPYEEAQRTLDVTLAANLSTSEGGRVVTL